ncbi:succinate dehydrogenase assembly factor 2 [Neiella sp. HB171785]|uniref:FAD assembly factor SdhE n=1 Tax=Neiella litorisoli TaxID=2771431 RepID=A0A8J6QUK6_9GAMM|nr:succinate dehydrogenase assembly factor 2 [Neiella litorisoli]MBD1389992.1 succinate dehydrogenase assembly factor 2 [Neiella litorisoli]
MAQNDSANEAAKDANLARLRWGCRRGMLELDVILEPFFDNQFTSLSEQQQQIFERLLGCDDPELFAWIMGHEDCKDAELAAMVKTIVDYNRSLLH